MIALLCTVLIAPCFANPAPKVPYPKRVFVPDDADPCEWDRFRANAYLAQWVRDMSPNTATASKCYHTPAKLLPVVSDLAGELDAGKWSQRGDARADLRAAALLGYRLDSLIDVTKDGQRSLGVILKQGVNGSTAGLVYTAR